MCVCVRVCVCVCVCHQHHSGPVDNTVPTLVDPRTTYPLVDRVFEEAWLPEHFKEFKGSVLQNRGMSLESFELWEKEIGAIMRAHRECE